MLLLHTCCAPCALPLLEYLLTFKKAEDIVLYFYNPNIFPRAEYDKRLEALKTIAKIYHLKLIVGTYEHQNWLEYLRNSLEKPLNSYQENQERCLKCFEFRLKQAIHWAAENHFEEWATTLSVNRFKDTNFINKYSQQLSQQFGIKYLPLNLDPYKTYQRERELVKAYNIYSQKYCGCEFSLAK
ncbi:MAG: epoxyqueuosine reductase QueH [Parcubacteria group bacterium]|nr:epoxyqueuosine reductase QueH [Parcubacteria group bacterium]